MRAALADALGPDVEVEPRPSDWGKDRNRLRWHRFQTSLRLARRAARDDVFVTMHGGSDVFVVAATLRLLRRRTRFVVVDFLMPTPDTRFRSVQRWVLARVDAFVCIRRGDVPTLQHRYGIPRSRCSFAYFPTSVDTDVTAWSAHHDYVFASGAAHRDWPTLFEALRRAECAAIVAVASHDVPAGAASERVRILEHVSPAEGQAFAAGAAIVVVPMRPTEQPAGPSVLVDAMSLGRPVIATDTAGTRDYVRDGVTGWLVPPADVAAMAARITEVLADAAARDRVGATAAHEVVTTFSPEQFASVIADACALSPRSNR